MVERKDPNHPDFRDVMKKWSRKGLTITFGLTIGFGVVYGYRYSTDVQSSAKDSKDSGDKLKSITCYHRMGYVVCKYPIIYN